MNLNIIIAGVGGQGTLLTSKVLGNVAEQLGYSAKISEVHGMSQRGGSVVTHVRMGEQIHSPIIEEKGADVVLAFEMLEGLRYASYLKEGGIMIVNSQQINPMPVIMGKADYPQDIPEKLNALNGKVQVIDAFKLALEAGSSRAVNIVILGALAGQLEIDKNIWLTAIEKTVAPKTFNINKIAFEKGYQEE